jgi:cyclic pyranopterin phosphate synthase
MTMQAHTHLLDTRGRPLRKLRISLTDRCNLRCSYCMPRERYEFMPQADLLRFEEIARLVRLLAGLGVHRIRLTGGEPLLRRDAHLLVEQLVQVAGIDSVALTTNGVLLTQFAPTLKAAGLLGLTISLDTLHATRFKRLTGRDGLPQVLAGIDAAGAAGFTRMKLNTVVMRGINDDEIVDIVDFARARDLQPRFIEYMDVGGAVEWRPEMVVPRAEILARIAHRYGPLRQLHNDDGAPADRYMLRDGFVFGVISSTTVPFCASCDRARLTADGVLFTCLYAQHGLDLRAHLRAAPEDSALQTLLADRWRARTDRGAELRLAVEARGPWVDVAALIKNPRLEMHKRGG